MAEPDPLANPENRRVYHENEKTAALLGEGGASWDVLPLPERYPEEILYPAVLIVQSPRTFTPDLRRAVEKNFLRLIYVTKDRSSLPAKAAGVPIFGFLAPPVRPVALQSLVQAAFENLSLARRQAVLEEEVQRARGEIEQLNQIGIMLSSERDWESLISLILKKCREITNSDAGSLYLVEEVEQGVKRLHFKITQNDSIRVSFQEFSIPLDSASVAGHVALTGEELHLEDAYQISSSLPFRFNPEFDQESGYRTKSMLVVPMRNPRGEIIGVAQLINCKRDPQLRIARDTVDETVIPFPEERRSLVRSLASQAAVAIENSRLYESIQQLFEGFVRASVIAIEARDPTTSGHSFRVADLTVGLAAAVERSDSPAFRHIRFSRSEMKEIRYASLLHDFGKVGVREEVLVKAKRLYPGQLDVIRQRFDFIRASLEQEHTERRLAYLLEKGREEYLLRQAAFQEELQEKLRELDEFFAFILKCNEPTVLAEENFHRLAEMAATRFFDQEGQTPPLLTPQELRLLSIPRGTLDERERQQIESHVVHTVDFLSQIPWTKEIKNVPAIAAAHHEKLDGSGYPYNLTAAAIPFQSKMMTIADIYDALTASDRPYKSAVAVGRALDILAEETKRGLLDAELFRLFHEAEIFKLTANWKKT
jgi:HD-GYP domain-containing protein (c-di-GMP phosphodiesterase class II)